MGYRLQVPGECEERISDSVAPEHLPGAKRPSWMTFRRAAGRIASAPACRCRLDNTPGTAPGAKRGEMFLDPAHRK